MCFHPDIEEADSLYKIGGGPITEIIWTLFALTLNLVSSLSLKLFLFFILFSILITVTYNGMKT